MAKLFDQQQLSAGVQEFEDHLLRARASDWTVDCQLAKPVKAAPAAGSRRTSAPQRVQPRPVGAPVEKVKSRRLLLGLSALALIVFVAATAATLSDWRAPSFTADSAGNERDAQAPSPSQVGGAAQPGGSAGAAALSKATPVAPAPAPSEVYMATIRPDGSLAPDTTPRGTYTPPTDATPPATVAPPVTVRVPASDLTTAPPTTTGQPASAHTVVTTFEAAGQNPPVAKPAKKRAVTHAANSVAKLPAAKPNAPPIAPSTAAKPEVVSPAAAKPAVTSTPPAPVAAEDGIFEGAQQAVGSITGAVKKLVGAD
jgi:hypothetical protein